MWAYLRDDDRVECFTHYEILWQTTEQGHPSQIHNLIRKAQKRVPHLELIREDDQNDPTVKGLIRKYNRQLNHAAQNEDVEIPIGCQFKLSRGFHFKLTGLRYRKLRFWESVGFRVFMLDACALYDNTHALVVLHDELTWQHHLDSDGRALEAMKYKIHNHCLQLAADKELIRPFQNEGPFQLIEKGERAPEVPPGEELARSMRALILSFSQNLRRRNNND